MSMVPNEVFDSSKFVAYLYFSIFTGSRVIESKIEDLMEHFPDWEFTISYTDVCTMLWMRSPDPNMAMIAKLAQDSHVFQGDLNQTKGFIWWRKAITGFPEASAFPLAI